MRLGLLFERAGDFERLASTPSDMGLELLVDSEEDELVTGLQDAGFEVVPIGDVHRLLEGLAHWRERCDLVLNRSMGYHGLERPLAGPVLLELAGIPYVGSTPYVHGIARNKMHTKLLAAAAGIPTPRAVQIHANRGLGASNDRDQLSDLATLDYPVIVKPVAESASVGIGVGSLADTPRVALRKALELAHRYHQPALVESLVSGVEAEVPVLIDGRPRALGVFAVELDGKTELGRQILTSERVFDLDYRYTDPPAGCDPAVLADLAERTADTMGLRDYCRVDFRVDRNGRPWLIEVNSLPDLQRHSAFFEQAQRRSLDYSSMLAEIIDVAWRRKDSTRPALG